MDNIEYVLLNFSYKIRATPPRKNPTNIWAKTSHAFLRTTSMAVRISCAEGLEFKSRAGQILYSVANSSPPLQHPRKLLGAMTRRWTPQTRYTLRRNTASVLNS